MRKAVSLLPLIALAACGAEESARRSTQEPAAEMMTDAAAPSITPSAAPGVAFNFRYAFRLPSERIAEVQEQHAAACEKLGTDRCRITGMRYRLINDRDIEAMLAFKLEPALARQFGKEGINAVGAADGMLVDSEISGEDVGSRIASVDRQQAELREDLAQVEARLKQPGLKAAERAELQAQADRLRQMLRANSAGQTERRDSLATTPMVFQYGSGNLAPGFDTRPSLQRAAVRAGENFVDGVSLLLVILITLAPWAAALGLAIWLYRKLRWRFAFLRPLEAEAAE